VLHEVTGHLCMTPSDIKAALRLASLWQQIRRLEAVDAILREYLDGPQPENGGVAGSSTGPEPLLTPTGMAGEWLEALLQQRLDAGCDIRAEGAALKVSLQREPVVHADLEEALKYGRYVLSPVIGLFLHRSMHAIEMCELCTAIDRRVAAVAAPSTACYGTRSCCRPAGSESRMRAKLTSVGGSNQQICPSVCRIATAAYGMALYAWQSRNVPHLGYLAAVAAPCMLCCGTRGCCCRPDPEDRIQAVRAAAFARTTPRLPDECAGWVCERIIGSPSSQSIPEELPVVCEPGVGSAPRFQNDCLGVLAGSGAVHADSMRLKVEASRSARVLLDSTGAVRAAGLNANASGAGAWCMTGSGGTSRCGSHAFAESHEAAQPFTPAMSGTALPHNDEAAQPTQSAGFGVDSAGHASSGGPQLLQMPSLPGERVTGASGVGAPEIAEFSAVRTCCQATHCFRQCDREAFLRLAGLQDEHLIYDSANNEAAKSSPYYVALDRERSSIVIAIRGSLRCSSRPPAPLCCCPVAFKGVSSGLS
jgi:hypothetical protein